MKAVHCSHRDVVWALKISSDATAQATPEKSAIQSPVLRGSGGP